MQRFAHRTGREVDGVDARRQRIVEHTEQGAQFGAAGGEFLAVAQGAGVDELPERGVGAHHVVEVFGVVAGLQGEVVEVGGC